MVNQELRAYKTWNILTKLASEAKDITYGELAGILGTHPQAVRYPLRLIQDYCKANTLPPLTVLVVRKDTKKPGRGFNPSSRNTSEKDRAEVWTKDWTKERNPFS